MMWPGGQTVGIVTNVPVLDDQGHPVVSEFMQAETAESVAWVRGCLFQVQEATSPRAREDETGGTTVVHMQAECVMPVRADGFIPAVDSDGQALDPIDASTLNAGQILRFGRDAKGAVKNYEMRGDAVITYDFAAPEHVYCLAEYQAG